MSWLLDTNVVSALRRPERSPSSLVAWAKDCAAGEVFLSVVTVLEIEIGILQVARRDKAQSKILRAWLAEQVLTSFEGRILPVDVEIALKCAALHVPDPRSERDALIAATALVRGLTVVTRNTSDFESLGVNLKNPWTSP